MAVGSALAVSAQAAPSAPSPVCSDWPATVGYDQINAGDPDMQAAYWVLGYTAVPGSRLRIHGAYPYARFFSFAVQDQAAITLGSLRDENIAADAGSQNPFRVKKVHRQTNAYTAYVDFGQPPSTGPARNTFYAGRTLEAEPNTSGTVIYRVYVPTDQRDRQGGVPLPTVELETPAGSAPLSFRPCASLPPKTGGPANTTIAKQSMPTAVPALQPRNQGYGAQPQFKRLFSGQFYDPAVQSLPSQAQARFPQRKGIPLANADFPYLISYNSRYYGGVTVVRFKAPTFPDTVRGASVVGGHQVRYWSLCSSSATEQGLHTYGCLADFLTRPDRNGFVWVVASDRAHKPSGVIDPSRGVHWLPFGPTTENYLFSRVGVPSATWKASPLNIKQSAPDQVVEARRVMGAYYPEARYCSAEQIHAHGLASCFS
jgi:hypothetical protein